MLHCCKENFQMKTSSWRKYCLLSILFHVFATISYSKKHPLPAFTGDNEKSKDVMKKLAHVFDSTGTVTSRLKLKNILTSRDNEEFLGILQQKTGSIMNTGRVEETSDFVFRLALPSVGQSSVTTEKEKEKYREKVLKQQNKVISRLRKIAPDMKVIGQTQILLNAVFINVAKPSLYEMAKDPAVSRIAPIGNYKLETSETVSYVRANFVHQSKGFTGKGVKIAVLDSGIDYTHANLGGEGTEDAYMKAYGADTDDPRNKRRDGLFPTNKVVEGYDFVGDKWPFGEIDPDEDPIDYHSHGTHVADIVAGTNGIAPDATLLAVKVCSSTMGKCNGMALIQGIEYAVDQEADIINLSIGTDFGQAFDDDLSYAIKSATFLGILTVAAAGNCGDIPYCTATPASERTALSVAQTEVPSTKEQFVTFNGIDYLAAFFEWSQFDPVSGRVVYGDGSSNTLGCDEFVVSLNRKLVVVDRGSCFFSIKVQNIEKAGGWAAIIANNEPGAPFPAGFGEGDLPTIPALMISQEDAEYIKMTIPDNIIGMINPDNVVSLAGTTVSTSARGPDMSYNAIKPEIGAPGASLSAIAGTGTYEAPFGGTSGAAPVVAGAAALLTEWCRNCSPFKIKALLMNNAFRSVISDTTGDPAEITRIGAGELRLDKAFNATFWAYSLDDLQPSFSLGLVDVTQNMTIRRKIQIINLSNEDKNLVVTSEFRSDTIASNKAMRIELRKQGNPITEIRLGRNSKIKLDVLFHLNVDTLPSNFMNSGAQGINPNALSSNEIDGYLVLTNDDGRDVSLPWHILVRKAASVEVHQNSRLAQFTDSISITNNGAGTAQIEVFDLVALSNEKKRGTIGKQMPTPDYRAIGVRTSINDECTSSFLLEFAVNTWDRQKHLLPVGFRFLLDMDQDGEFDYEVMNVPYSDVIELSAVVDLYTFNATSYWQMEHATNTANSVIRICGEQMGLDLSDLHSSGPKIDVKAFADDVEFFGPGDEVAHFTIIPFGERYWAYQLEPIFSLDIAPGQEDTLAIGDMGPADFVNPESYGLMLFANGDRGEGNRGAATENTEAHLLLAPGVKSHKTLAQQNITRSHFRRKKGTDLMRSGGVK